MKFKSVGFAEGKIPDKMPREKPSEEGRGPTTS
jgi:hypothetical protein